MKYIVVKSFVDLKDKNHRYEAGEEYPRLGLKVSSARLDELSTSKNKRGIALIKAIVEEEVVPEAPEMPVEDEVKKDVVVTAKPTKKASTPKRGRKKNAE